jgi:hypothetical protein
MNGLSNQGITAPIDQLIGCLSCTSSGLELVQWYNSDYVTYMKLQTVYNDV